MVRECLFIIKMTVLCEKIRILVLRGKSISKRDFSTCTHYWYSVSTSYPPVWLFPVYLLGKGCITFQFGNWQWRRSTILELAEDTIQLLQVLVLDVLIHSAWQECDRNLHILPPALHNDNGSFTFFFSTCRNCSFFFLRHWRGFGVPCAPKHYDHSFYGPHKLLPIVLNLFKFIFL